MKNLLRTHPFPVLAHFERVVAVSFAFPEKDLKPLVPPGLTLDTFEGLGFLTVALVWTRSMRPKGFPKFLGRNFFLCGYRIFTRLRNEDGRNLRGLRILRSETDKAGMVIAGNIFTHYNYRRVKVSMDSEEGFERLRITDSRGRETVDMEFRKGREEVALPDGSPFRDWRTARRFAGPMPFTFSPNGDGSFIVIEGIRDQWKPQPVEVKAWKVGLFEETPLRGVSPVLANAFEVRDVDYEWTRGRVMKSSEPV